MDDGDDDDTDDDTDDDHDDDDTDDDNDHKNDSYTAAGAAPGPHGSHGKDTDQAWRRRDLLPVRRLRFAAL